MRRWAMCRRSAILTTRDEDRFPMVRSGKLETNETISVDKVRATGLRCCPRSLGGAIGLRSLWRASKRYLNYDNPLTDTVCYVSRTPTASIGRCVRADHTPSHKGFSS